MAAVNFVSDINKLWMLWWNPSLNIWRTFLGTISLVAVSPNMPSAIGAGVQVTVLGGKTASDDDKAFGPLFRNYAYTLLRTYGVVFGVIMICASLAAVMYVWVAVPAILVAFLVASCLSWVCISRMKGRSDLTDALLKDLETSPTSSNLMVYFFILMVLPCVQFLVLAQMRWLDGYGYMESFYLTITERHIRAYAGVVESSAMHGLLLVWMVL
mmetsp:Transcript_2346/g.3625  ORF Transcript_2346/g.3625 Transcript_2346/m.3625 type:complete len:213 (-) Transcript_2346:90-728(-)